MTFSNFIFLRKEFPRLYRIADLTEDLVISDKFAAMVNMKAITNEVITILSKENEMEVIGNDFDGLIHALWKSGAISKDVYFVLREIELFNVNESEIVVDLSRIEHLYRGMYDFLVWFYKTKVDHSFVPSAFMEPSKPSNIITISKNEETDDETETSRSSISIDGIPHNAEWNDNVHLLTNYGISQYDNGERCEGQLEQGIKQGKGIYVWNDGTIYKGHWSNDMEHGLGEKWFANGDSYRGYWESGIYSGQGVYRWADGSSYEGQWQDGMEHGFGTKTNAEGIQKKGFWTYGEFAYTTEQIK